MIGPRELNRWTLAPPAFARLPARSRREVAREGEALIAWLRPDAAQREVRWAPD